METITKLSQLDFSKVYSYADYLQWRLDVRVELIKGKLFPMSPAPSSTHQQISTALSALVWLHFKNKPCQVFEAPFDVRLNKLKAEDVDSITVVQPDLCIICDPDKIDKRGCNGAPDLVVEILSPGNSKKEMKEKMQVYEENGVKEYWLVNPLDRNVIIYLLENGKYKGLKPYLDEDILHSPTFPEMQIELVEIFENII